MPHFRSVGIDVSKNSLDICVFASDNKFLSSKFTNDLQGINEISEYLISLKVNKKSPIVIESTGDYHLLVSYNLGKSFNVQIINPLISKGFIDSNVRKIKSDKADALALAKIGTRAVLTNHLFNNNELHKRKLISQIDNLEKHKAALNLSLKNLKKTMNDFNMESESFVIIDNAIDEIEKAIQVLQKELKPLIGQTKLLKTIEKQKGIGSNSAAVVLALLEDRTFKSKGSLVAYCGLDISVRESGKWRGKTRLTKRGNSFLRKYLIRIGWGLYMHNESFQLYAKKYKEKGRRYLEVLVILARKFVRMLYGALKSNGNFNIEYLTKV